MKRSVRSSFVASTQSLIGAVLALWMGVGCATSSKTPQKGTSHQQPSAESSHGFALEAPSAVSVLPPLTFGVNPRSTHSLVPLADAERMAAAISPITPRAQVTLPPMQTVTLAWSLSPSEEVIGYAIYYGDVAGVITNVIDVGPVLTTTIPFLQAGITYHFFATAYTIDGIESLPSNVVTYNVPTTLGLFEFASYGIELDGNPGTNLFYYWMPQTDILRIRIQFKGGWVNAGKTFVLKVSGNVGAPDESWTEKAAITIPPEGLTHRSEAYYDRPMEGLPFDATNSPYGFVARLEQTEATTITSVTLPDTNSPINLNLLFQGLDLRGPRARLLHSHLQKFPGISSFEEVEREYIPFERIPIWIRLEKTGAIPFSPSHWSTGLTIRITLSWHNRLWLSSTLWKSQ
ncbi:MAG: fibronectin type III domain-containing protein [Candidatus Taylorbacteria bacterium]